MHALLDELRARCAEIADLEKASYLLDWDEETHMPRGGSDERMRQKAALQRAVSERWTSDRLASLLEALAPLVDELDPRSDEARLVHVVGEDVARARRVPVELQVALAEANARGYRDWLEARAQRDFEAVRPALEDVIRVRREHAAALRPDAEPYDALLDEWEPGLTARELDRVFAELEPALRSLLAEAARDEAPDGRLAGPFPVEGQRRLTLWMLRLWGFDPAAWRLDDGVHPSQYSVALADVRITARFDEGTLAGVFASLHEFGHGLGRRQVSPGLSRTPLREPASSALDEATARLLENVVGRRLAAWRFAYPRAQAELGGRLSHVPLERFYRAINEVRPSPIRATADEVTYGLHVVVRYELERELVSGSLRAADLPEAFDARLEEALGVRPKDVDEGVLQDPHWFDLGFGYFPTVTLGDVIALQMWERAEGELGDLDALLERGDCDPLRAWLGERLHVHGRKFSAPETIELATGGPLDPRPYVDYLRTKYGELARGRR